MRVAIIENTRITHHGQVGVALHEAGARVRAFHPYAGEPLPNDTNGFDALVVFGGEQNALADHTHPYLPQLAGLMRQFCEDDRAVLGICLGSQVLARAFDAENHIGTAPEFGWQEIRLTDAAAADPVLGVLPPAFRSFQWHSDTFTLPQGAVHLAKSNTAAHQAYRIGRAAYGMQFHFEANRRVVGDWNREFPDLIESMVPDWAARHAAEAPVLGAAADDAGLALARAWVAQV